MGKKSRTKGAAGENEVVKLLENIFPEAARELDQYQEQLGRDLKWTMPLCIQVKRHKEIAPGDIWNAFTEASSAVDDDYTWPIVFYREDRKSWRAATNLSVIAEIMGTNAVPEDEYVMADMDAKAFAKWFKEGYIGAEVG
jgi:hypothetical protein